MQVTSLGEQDPGDLGKWEHPHEIIQTDQRPQALGSQGKGKGSALFQLRRETTAMLCIY